MPVKVWTGLPGAGKTACMVAEILKFKRDHPHRPVYAINVNGLADGIAEPLTLDQLRKWWELPPESLICIDECQEDDYFPLDQGKPAEWVKRISKVRHEGMDFWMTTQHPSLISAYVRRLIDQHVHSVRKFNSHVVQRFTWGRCMETCEKGGAQKTAIVSVGTLPKEVFDSYKSSNAHNMKRRIPLKAWLFPVLVVVGIGAIVATPILIKRARDKNVASISTIAHPADGAASADASMREKDYVKWVTPRIPSMPWTAPAYDAATVQVQPRVFCIAADDGDTRCITEQGTDFDLPAADARLVAAHGVYDPFLRPVEDRRQDVERAQPDGKPQARPGEPAQRPDVLAASGGGGVGPQAEPLPQSVMRADYVPPQYMPPNQ